MNMVHAKAQKRKELRLQRLNLPISSFHMAIATQAITNA
jgi:hypothetical protein